MRDRTVVSGTVKGTSSKVWLFPLLLLALPVVYGKAEVPPEMDLHEFYQQNCSGCHGTDGAALDANGKKLRGRDLTEAVWQRGTRDQTMVKAIMKGVFFGWAMPAYGDKLTNLQAQKIVDIIRKSSKGRTIAIHSEVYEATR